MKIFNNPLGFDNKMKLALIFLLTLIQGASLVLAQKKSLSIGEPVANDSIWFKASNDGVEVELFEALESLPSSISTSVSATNKFDVVARGEQLAKIFEEQELGQTGAIARESAAQINQLTGAAFAILPTITDFGYGIGSSTTRLTGRTRETEEARISCNLRMVDTTTGKITERSLIVSEKNTMVSQQTNIGSGLIQTLINKLANEIVSELVDEAFPARIVGKIGKRVTINRGEGLGVEVGQIWRVFALGKEMIDPDTGESLGQVEAEVGRMSITQVQSKVAYGNLIEDFGVEELFIARFDKESSPPPAREAPVTPKPSIKESLDF
jgi:hypothetical protein